MTSPTDVPRRILVDGRHIECRRIGRAGPSAPTLVFLHEGLGSVRMWRDFPDRLCAALGLPGLVYSRLGYGASDPLSGPRNWRFMHEEATVALPALLRACAIERPILFGHSDGASIALLYAARFPRALSGAVLLAPHILVEAISVASIAKAREAYRDTDLRARLARHHDDPDSAFGGWNDVWLRPEFRHWSIADEIATIRCPLLAIQGEDDEYGTLAQVQGIAQRVPGTRLLVLPQCGHSPHRDQPQAVIEGTRAFLADTAVAAPGIAPETGSAPL